MNTLEEYAGGEFSEIVANYEWRPVDSNGKSYGVEIKIKVHKESESRFIALPSHRVKTPGQAGPYMSADYEDSVDKAVRSCLRGFKMFMGTAAETEWPPNEYF